jgi:4a-hydroxytetrahydrobiopterin dehydratase
LKPHASGYVRIDPAVLSDADIEQFLADASEWHRAPASIVRDLSFPDFASAITFVERVAARAEAANHHPDILVHGWNKVRLTLSTHSAGGLTEADFALAREIDAIDGND